MYRSECLIMSRDDKWVRSTTGELRRRATLTLGAAYALRMRLARGRLDVNGHCRGDSSDLSPGRPGQYSCRCGWSRDRSLETERRCVGVYQSRLTLEYADASRPCLGSVMDRDACDAVSRIWCSGLPCAQRLDLPSYPLPTRSCGAGSFRRLLVRCSRCLIEYGMCQTITGRGKLRNGGRGIGD